MKAHNSSIATAAIIVTLTSSCWAQEILNGDSNTSDSHPSVVESPTSGLWMAWHGYADHADGVYARSIATSHDLEHIVKLSSVGSIPGPPTVANNTRDEVVVVWPAQIDGHWRISYRARDQERWLPEASLSDLAVDAIYPTVITADEGRSVAAWSEYRDGHFRVAFRWLDVDGADPDATTISSQDVDAFRPALVEDGSGAVWAAWDEYDGTRYRVRVRKIAPLSDDIADVSSPDVDGLTPTLLSAKNRIVLSWLEKQNVIGGAGAISQWHTLHAAELIDGAWQRIVDEDGKAPGAELTQGLMAKIEPKPLATGGYLGRRTTPMLVEAGDDVWLLWERKANHSGSTPFIAGDLLGRPFRNGTWGEPALLHTGHVDYHLAHPERAVENKFTVIASDLPRDERRNYHRISVNLNGRSEFKQDEWPGWKPVDLPVQDELTERQSIEIDGKAYHLYWADMHCHSGLTTDAEGEHDELCFYARDRAKLDVVVFTNNDFLYDCFLTEYEFAIGNFFANLFTRADHLSLPGYEWTSRVPGKKGVPFSVRGNWTAPFRNGSYPNHRSVIYPAAAGPLVRFPEVENDIENLNAAVEKAGGLTLSQHEAFLLSGHKIEVGLELTSGWRNYIRRKPELFHNSLKPGVRLGFVANGDSHRRAPGLSGALTGIYAEEHSQAAIFEALKNRRCFATSGSRVMLDARANGVFMGQDAKASDGKATLSLRVIATRDIVKAQLIGNAKIVAEYPGSGENELTLEHSVTDLEPGEHWFYWRVTLEGDAPAYPGNVEVAFGNQAWSTPMWVIAELK